MDSRSAYIMVELVAAAPFAVAGSIGVTPVTKVSLAIAVLEEIIERSGIDL